jgi:hypothetical protein
VQIRARVVDPSQRTVGGHHVTQLDEISRKLKHAQTKLRRFRPIA